MYISINDLLQDISETTLVSLTNDENRDEYNLNDSNDLIVKRINSSILNADSLIDLHLSKRYTTPISPIPKIIKLLSKQITKYFLWSRREVVPESVEGQYKNSLNILKDISIGDIDLDDFKTSYLYLTNKTAEQKIFDYDIK